MNQIYNMSNTAVQKNTNNIISDVNKIKNQNTNNYNYYNNNMYMVDSSNISNQKQKKSNITKKC